MERVRKKMISLGSSKQFLGNMMLTFSLEQRGQVKSDIAMSSGTMQINPGNASGNKNVWILDLLPQEIWYHTIVFLCKITD